MSDTLPFSCVRTNPAQVVEYDGKPACAGYYHQITPDHKVIAQDCGFCPNSVDRRRVQAKVDAASAEELARTRRRQFSS